LNYLKALPRAAHLINSVSVRFSVLRFMTIHEYADVEGFRRFVAESAHRSSSVYWLGQVGGSSAFLSRLIRNEAEDKKLDEARLTQLETVASAVAMPTIQGLYDSVNDVDIRKAHLSAGNYSDEQPAFAFLLGVAKDDADWQSRRNAARQLGHLQSRDAVDQ
jgi:hypothetical protein